MIKIKKARKRNFKEIAKIYMEEFSKPPFNEPWTIKKAYNKLKLFSRYCDIWEIVFQDKLVGFIIINPNQWCTGEIIFGEEMAIKKDFQKKGIGAKVFKIIFNLYKKKGFKRYFGMVNEDSQSVKLHKKIGAIKNKELFIWEKKLK
jgi:predicted acetyltransferase